MSWVGGWGQGSAWYNLDGQSVLPLDMDIDRLGQDYRSSVEPWRQRVEYVSIVQRAAQATAVVITACLC